MRARVRMRVRVRMRELEGAKETSSSWRRAAGGFQTRRRSCCPKA